MSIPRFAELRDDQAVRERLAADLAALDRGDGAGPSSGDVVTRPSVLRRIARVLAEIVEPGVDRIVAGADDLAVATACSIHTGLPFAVVGADGTVATGELHALERVVAVGLRPEDAADAATGAVAVGATVAASAGIHLTGEDAGALAVAGVTA
ncbi:MAG: hypothetical protein ACTH0C_12950 [Actinomycetaceae bacterium]